MCTDCLDDDVIHEARIELNERHVAQSEMTFLSAGKLEDMRDRTLLIHEQDEIVIFRTPSGFIATSNICPHQENPSIIEGTLDLDHLTITCPMHDWRFKIGDGDRGDADGTIRTYHTRIVGDEVWVEEPKELANS